MDYRLLCVDLVAITILTFALYYLRHRRKDLAVALIGVNVGVLAVTTMLSQSTVSAGLGLGLFGVLSIIRLRSSELSQIEVAYYFAALAIGLIGGLGSGVDTVLAIVMISAIVVALGITDSSLMMKSSRHMHMNVDRAIPETDRLIAYIEEVTGWDVREVSIVRIDYVNDSTLVDLRVIDAGSKTEKDSKGTVKTKGLRAA